MPSLKRHRRVFRRAPQLYGADRGFFSQRNVMVCARGGVATECIPQRGGSKTPQRQAYERSAPFKQGQRFRAGIEGRISVLMRGRGMKRCRAQTLRGIAEQFQHWLKGWSGKRDIPILDAPQGRRDDFVDPYFNGAKADSVVVFLEAREPARIMTAIGDSQTNRWHLQISNRRFRVDFKMVP